MAVRKLTLIILTLATLALPGAGRASLRTCDSVFSANPSLRTFLFAFEDPAHSLRTTDARSTVFLGAGTTARVELVFDSSVANRPFVQKVYTHTQRSKERAVADQALFEVFSQLAKTHSLGFQIPTTHLELKPVFPAAPPSYIMTLTYTPGRTVHDLLVDPSISPAFKKQISDSYLSRLSQLESTLKAQRADAQIARQPSESKFFGDGKPDALPILGGQAAGQNLYIKSDNVIVEPTSLEMTLIDPY